jgi:hypothetical protein
VVEVSDARSSAATTRLLGAVRRRSRRLGTSSPHTLEVGGVLVDGGALNNLFSFAQIKRPSGRGIEPRIVFVFVFPRAK